jgi:hypothetical protein
MAGQVKFEASATPVTIWFGFNGAGKTLSAARRLVAACEGRDPCLRGVRPRPLRILLCVTGFEAQSTIDLARQLHEIAPPDLFAQVDIDDDGNQIGRPRPWYSPGRGFKGRPPRLVVLRGPFSGSVINVTTLGAGSMHSAGGTVDIILVNEPITREVWDELAGRDRVGSLGILWYVFTPTPRAPSQEWVEEVVENAPKNSLTYIQTELVEDSYTIPTGAEEREVTYQGRTLKLVSRRYLEPQAKTAARVARWSEHSRPQRCGRSLRPFLDENYFSKVWTSEVIDDNPGIGGWLVAGIDYSTKDGRTRFVLVKWYAAGSPRSFLGHVVVDVRATTSDPDTVAREVLDALKVAGIPVESIDAWVGDRAAIADRGLTYRDNVAFRSAMLGELRRRSNNASLKAPQALWEIKTPRKPAGYSWAAKSFIRNMLSHKPTQLHIMSRCVHLIEDFESWDGTAQSRFKDGLDALGYGAEVGARHYGLWTSTE